jgi:hypothetical protein
MVMSLYTTKTLELLENEDKPKDSKKRARKMSNTDNDKLALKTPTP